MHDPDKNVFDLSKARREKAKHQAMEEKTRKLKAYGAPKKPMGKVSTIIQSIIYLVLLIYLMQRCGMIKVW